MAISEYRKKGGIVAYHFTDCCGCDDDLKKLGVTKYDINICNCNGSQRVTMSIIDDNKNCLCTARLGDYIVRMCNAGKLLFEAVPQARFEADYEYVQDLDAIDDDCTPKSMQDMFCK